MVVDKRAWWLEKALAVEVTRSFCTQAGLFELRAAGYANDLLLCIKRRLKDGLKMAELL